MHTKKIIKMNQIQWNVWFALAHASCYYYWQSGKPSNVKRVSTYLLRSSVILNIYDLKMHGATFMKTNAKTSVANQTYIK